MHPALPTRTPRKEVPILSKFVASEMFRHSPNTKTTCKTSSTNPSKKTHLHGFYTQPAPDSPFPKSEASENLCSHLILTSCISEFRSTFCVRSVSLALRSVSSVFHVCPPCQPTALLGIYIPVGVMCQGLLLYTHSLTESREKKSRTAGNYRTVLARTRYKTAPKPSRYHTNAGHRFVQK